MSEPGYGRNDRGFLPSWIPVYGDTSIFYGLTGSTPAPPPARSSGGVQTLGSTIGSNGSGGLSVNTVVQANARADFHYNVLSGNTVAFHNNSLNGPFWFCYWDFMDGQTSTDMNPTHQFASPGTYAVSLSMKNSNGRMSTKVVSVTIASQPVSAGISVTQSAFTVAFAPDCNFIVGSAFWHFGDGETSSDIFPTHRYAANGTYTVIGSFNGNVVATVDVTINADVVLYWTDNSSDETGFNVYRSNVSSEGPWDLQTTVGADVTTAGVSLAEGAGNWFLVRANDDGGESESSNVIFVPGGA